MEGAFPSSSYIIQEQFYPNANCQNLGPGNPYTDGGYYRDNWPNGYAMMEHHPRHRTHRHHHR